MLTRTRFLLFIVSVMVFATAIPVLLGLAFRKGDYTKVWWLWNKKKATHYSWAVVGNSTPLCGIDTRTLEDSLGGPCINLAISDSDFSTYYIVLAYFLKHNKNQIDNLLIQVSLNELTEEAREDDDNLYNFIPYLDDSLVHAHYANMYPQDARLYKWMPVLAYGKYNAKLGPLPAANSLLGFKKPNFSSYGDLHYDRPYAFDDTLTTSIYTDTIQYTAKPYSEAFNYLKKIKALAQECGIKRIVIFTMPKLKHRYVLYQGQDVAVDAISKAAVQLELPYLNTLELFDPYDFHLYVDHDHLSATSARSYTAILSDSLRNLFPLEGLRNR